MHDDIGLMQLALRLEGQEFGIIAMDADKGDTANGGSCLIRRTGLQRQRDSCRIRLAMKASRTLPKKKRCQKPRRRLPAGMVSATRARSPAAACGKGSQSRQAAWHRCGPAGPGRGSARCLRCRSPPPRVTVDDRRHDEGGEPRIVDGIDRNAAAPWRRRSRFRSRRGRRNRPEQRRPCRAAS